MTKRSGKTLTVLPDGHPRRLADGRNAWRKMNAKQRREFVVFQAETDEEFRELIAAARDLWVELYEFHPKIAEKQQARIRTALDWTMDVMV